MTKKQNRKVSSVPLIVILGPTAVGKTGLAIDLAVALNGEIVSADSRQVYRYMDIGTAKPTAEQRGLIPHYLLDVVNPDDNLSVAQYQRLAYYAIDRIHARSRIPFLVGGTGQYITAVIEGWSIPEVPPNPSLRAELEAFAKNEGADALLGRLAQLDPDTAQKIDPHNIRRVIRAIEVSVESGQPFSELQQKHAPPYTMLEYGLTMERDALYQRADIRVDQMMEQGFLEEVRRLLDMGYERSLPSMSGLGYAQLAAHILDHVPLDQAVASTKHATHDFIRRQYTWFRGHDRGVVWHNIQQIDLKQLISASQRWLQEHG
jgi:tRNA dimethylallyltransferase